MCSIGIIITFDQKKEFIAKVFALNKIEKNLVLNATLNKKIKEKFYSTVYFLSLSAISACVVLFIDTETKFYPIKVLKQYTRLYLGNDSIIYSYNIILFCYTLIGIMDMQMFVASEVYMLIQINKFEHTCNKIRSYAKDNDIILSHEHQVLTWQTLKDLAIQHAFMKRQVT